MPRKRKGDPVHGWVNFDKPYEMGSTQAVGKIRRLFNAQKAGHAGTLDPLATGILPIALGEATKTVPFLVNADKRYSFEISWGEHRDTLDKEGDVIERSDIRPNEASIRAVLPEFTGLISQIPPKYSAIKIKGQRAYDLARSGEEVTLKARQIEVKALELVWTKPDMARFNVHCGKGTYIRSLARDMAARLGALGYVSLLRRTQVGPFTQKDAFTLDSLTEIVHRAHADQALLGLATVLDDIPVYAAGLDEQNLLRQGRAIHVPEHFAKQYGDISNPAEKPQIDISGYILAQCETTPIALCLMRDGQLWPKRVFQL